MKRGNNSPHVHEYLDIGSGNPAITFPCVETFGAIAAFSTRQGGHSPAPFDSLNFSTSDGDSEINVEKNLRTLGNWLGIEPATIAFCRQVHGDSVRIVAEAPTTHPVADAIISVTRNVLPAIKTADCLPILLFHAQTGISAGIHAGWRGTVLRIARKTVEVMNMECSIEPSTIVAILGPAIGPCCYEVDEAVLSPFRENLPHAEQFIVTKEDLKKRGIFSSSAHSRQKRSDAQSERIDLGAANRSDLISAGISPSNIFATGLCTACRPDLFYSYRRDNGKTGRHVALGGFLVYHIGGARARR